MRQLCHDRQVGGLVDGVEDVAMHTGRAKWRAGWSVQGKGLCSPWPVASVVCTADVT